MAEVELSENQKIAKNLKAMCDNKLHKLDNLHIVHLKGHKIDLKLKNNDLLESNLVNQLDQIDKLRASTSSASSSSSSSSAPAM